MTTIERQLGEIAARQEYILKKVDALDAKVNVIQQKVEDIKIEQAERAAERKTLKALSGLIGGLVGAVTSLIGSFAVLGGWLR